MSHPCLYPVWLIPHPHTSTNSTLLWILHSSAYLSSLHPRTLCHPLFCYYTDGSKSYRYRISSPFHWQLILVYTLPLPVFSQQSYLQSPFFRNSCYTSVPQPLPYSHSQHPISVKFKNGSFVCQKDKFSTAGFQAVQARDSPIHFAILSGWSSFHYSTQIFINCMYLSTHETCWPTIFKNKFWALEPSFYSSNKSYHSTRKWETTPAWLWTAWKTRLDSIFSFNP